MPMNMRQKNAWEALTAKERTIAHRIAVSNLLTETMVAVAGVLYVGSLLFVVMSACTYGKRVVYGDYEQTVCHNAVEVTYNCGYIICDASATARVLETGQTVSMQAAYLTETETRHWLMRISSIVFPCFVRDTAALTENQMMYGWEPALIAAFMFVAGSLAALWAMENDEITVVQLVNNPGMRIFLDVVPYEMVGLYTRYETPPKLRRRGRK
jgi:hypothetical protein